MKKVRCLLILILALFLLTSISQAEILSIFEKDGVKYAGEGWATEYNGLKVVYYSGTPEEIGQQHGLLVMAAGGEELLNYYEKMKEQMQTGNKYLDTFRNLYAKFKLIPAFKRHIPREYLSELRGMVVALTGGKSDNYDEFIMANAGQDLSLVMGCSIFAGWDTMTETGELIVGRNLDHLGFADSARFQYLAFYNPDRGYKFVTLNYPSYVGLMQGMNEKGLVIGMTYSVVKPEETSIDGLPYIFMLRQVLQYAGNLEEAVNIIKETPRTVGLNIVLASARDHRAIVVETSANRLYIREAEDFIYATNRFRSSYMQKYQGGGWLASSLRDLRFEELHKELKGKLNYQNAISVLRDKFAPGSAAARGYIDSGIENIGTMASLVFRPDKLQVFISTRTKLPVPEGEYIGFDCEEIWQTGKPVPPLEIIPAAEKTSFNQRWLQIRQAELASIHGKKDKVRELLEPILQTEPDAEFPLLLMGINYIKLREIDKGIELLERLVNLPEIAEPYHLLVAYFWLGAAHDIFIKDRTKAVNYYQKALEVQIPDMPGDADYFRRMVEAGLQNPLVVKNGRIVRSN